MSIEFYFSEKAVDIRDPRNETGRAPPLDLEVGEADGWVCLRIGPADGAGGLRQCCMEDEQVGRLIAALQEARRAARR